MNARPAPPTRPAVRAALALALGGAGLLAGPVAVAAEPARCAPEKMIRVVIQDTTPGIDPASFAARPKTLLRLGSKYGRMAEERDPASGSQSLIVVSQPDVWIADLATRTGQHVLEPAPFEAPIAPVPEVADELAGFEFGCELAYVRARGVQPESVSLGGKALRAYKFHAGRYTIQLLTLADRDVPYAASVHRDDKPLQILRYLEYETGLAPDMKLFARPQGIAFAEGPGAP